LGQKSPIVFLLPGIHKISALYADITGGNSDSYTVSYTGQMSIEFDFKAGHIYRFYPVIENDSVRLAIADETEPLVFKSSKYRYDAWHRVKEVKEKLKL
jgi:hypothetical protein